MSRWSPTVLPEAGLTTPELLGDALMNYAQARRQRVSEALGQEESRTRIRGARVHQRGEEADIAARERERPLEEAIFRATAYRTGVRTPDQLRAGAGPPPPMGRGNQTQAGPGSVPIQFPTVGNRVQGESSGLMGPGGRPAGQPFSMPGEFNPAINTHNPAEPVDLGGGYGYVDPETEALLHYRGAGFSGDEAALAARTPGIGETLFRNRALADYRETPEERAARERANIGFRGESALSLAEAKARLRLNHDQLLLRAKTKLGIQGRGKATMKQLLDWTDMNYAGFAGGPSLTPDARYELAQELFQRQGGGADEGDGGSPFPPKPVTAPVTRQKRGRLGEALHALFGSRDEEPAAAAPDSTRAGPPAGQAAPPPPPPPDTPTKRRVTQDQADFLRTKGRWDPTKFEVQ